MEDKKNQKNNLIDPNIFKKEKEARIKAERLIEEKMRKLYLANQNLRNRDTELDITDNEIKSALIECLRVRKQLEQMVNYDGLTNLPNEHRLRTDLTYLLVQAKRINQKIALLFIDINRFSEINNSYGSDVADNLLKQVALRLQMGLSKDDFAARINGDLFAIVLTKIENDHATGIIAERVLAQFSFPFTIQEQMINLGVSIGISMFPDTAINTEELIATAHAALKSAKQIGSICFSRIASPH
jgi:diguanylate cyclase (GGDEF)-like protein